VEPEPGNMKALYLYASFALGSGIYSIYSLQLDMFFRTVRNKKKTKNGLFQFFSSRITYPAPIGIIYD